MSTNQSAPNLENLQQQYNAALSRRSDLERQLADAQGQMNKLGFMQLGKKMRLSSEIENINRKLATNRQLLTSLEDKIHAARSAQPAASAEAPVTEAPAQTAEAPEEVVEAPAEAPSAPVAEVSEAAAPARPAPAAPAAPKKPRPAAPRARKPLIDETQPLEQQVAQMLAHLEAYFPEHQLFAVEVLGMQTRLQLASLAERCGHASPAALLEANGWRLLPYTEARALCLGRYTTPGQEPAVIMPKLNSVLARLTHHYPDKVIARSIQHDHKGLAQDVSALSVYLGYESIGAMLTAYGFRYDVPAGGRPATDVDRVVNALKAAYKGAAKPRTIAQIAADHPEYAAAIKTLQNQAPKRFGMSLRQYFMQQGLM